MQYWINHNGVQSGPMDLDALKQMGLTSAAYVWHEGLSDWVKITQIPELQDVYVMEGAAPEVAEIPEVPPVQRQDEPVAREPYQPQRQPAQPYQPAQPQYAGPQPANAGLGDYLDSVVLFACRNCGYRVCHQGDEQVSCR